MIRKLLISVLLLIFSVSLFAQSQGIAVVPLNSSSGLSKSELSIMTEYLEAALANTNAFNLIASQQRDAIISELQFSSSGCSDQSCALEIGQLLSAEYMVFGTVNKQSNTYIMSIKKVNVETSMIEVNAIDTMITLAPAQIEAVTTKLAYELAGIKYEEEDRQIQSYSGSIELRVNIAGARAIFNLSEEYTRFPATVEDVPVGDYPLRVTADGYEASTLTVSVRKGEVSTVNIQLERSAGPKQRPPVGQGFLSIFSSPPGMDIMIDNQIIDDKTPLEDFLVNAGEHQIVVGDFYNSFFKDNDFIVQINAGESHEVPVEMERQSGKLNVKCGIEGAGIYINGKREAYIENGQATILNIPTGVIEVAISRDRYVTSTNVVQLRPLQLMELEIELHPMPVRVIFDSNPQGALVTFDGDTIGKTPTLLNEVNQGNYDYYFTYNGYTTDTQILTVEGVEDKTIIKDLSGSIEVVLSDGKDGDCEVDLDGEYQGTTQGGRLRITGQSYGAHLIELKKEGYETYSRNIVLGESMERVSTDLMLQDIKYAILTEPSGATVFINNVRQPGQTPMTVPLGEGAHEIRVSMPGFLQVRERVVVDSPRGQRIRLTLIEGEDVVALMEHFRERVDELEIEDAGLLQCLNTRASLEELLVEVEGYAGDIESIKTFINDRIDYYHAREAAIEVMIDVAKRDIIRKKEQAENLRAGANKLVGWEIASIAGTIVSAAGAYYSATEAMSNYELYQNAQDSIQAADYRSATEQWSLALGVSAGIALITGITDLILPGKIKAKRTLAGDLDGAVTRVAADLARMEMTRAMESPVRNEALSFILNKVDWAGISPEDGSSIYETSPALDWDNVSRASSYEVQFGESPGEVSDSRIWEQRSSDFQLNSDSGLTSGESLYWRVRAVDNMGISGIWSDIYSFSTREAISWNLFSPAQESVTKDSTPKFNWDNVSGTDYYEIDYSAGSSSFRNSETVRANISEYQLPSTQAFSPGDDVYWRVRAVDNQGVTSPWSEARSFSIFTEKPVTSRTSTSRSTAGATPLSSAKELQIGDRVVAITERDKVKVGMTGTYYGPGVGTALIPILWDEDLSATPGTSYIPETMPEGQNEHIYFVEWDKLGKFPGSSQSSGSGGLRIGDRVVAITERDKVKVGMTGTYYGEGVGTDLIPILWDTDLSATPGESYIPDTMPSGKNEHIYFVERDKFERISSGRTIQVSGPEDLYIGARVRATEDYGKVEEGMMGYYYGPGVSSNPPCPIYFDQDIDATPSMDKLPDTFPQSARNNKEHIYYMEWDMLELIR